MTLDKDTVDWNHVTRLKSDDISDHNIVDQNLLSPSRADNLDLSVIFLPVELHELTFFLPVVGGSNNDNDRDGHDDGYTFYPFDLGFAWFMFDAKSLVQSECKRYDRRCGQEQQYFIVISHPRQLKYVLWLLYREPVISKHTYPVSKSVRPSCIRATVFNSSVGRWFRLAVRGCLLECNRAFKLLFVNA